MLGMYSVLPLLKGWEWRLYQGTYTVKRGETVEITRVNETGLIIGAMLIADDCEASAVVNIQGAELRTETLEYSIEEYATVGLIESDPNGWVTRYLRPDPASTAGYYVLEVVPGLYGAPLPFIPTMVLNVRLKAASTQSQATISAAVRAINIVNKVAFIQSLRRLQNPNSALDIDPALLVIGPAEFHKVKT